MRLTKASISYAADDLIDRYGAKARQKVVDEIVIAVRNHDIDTAKLWDEIGQLVDEKLNISPDQLSFL
jgi:GTP:adenosylcobinamide-phosphate guanylyltransferase